MMRDSRRLSSDNGRDQPGTEVTYRVCADWHGAGPHASEQWVRLSHCFGILKCHCWKILSFVALCLIATAIISARLVPIYESTAIIDIDRHMPVGILGQEATQYPTADVDQFLATQLTL